MAHTCHAHECNTPVPPSMFMCRPHWYSLPKPVRDAIWREYRKGQENDKDPSFRYMAVQRLAVARAAFKPYNERAAIVCAEYLEKAIMWQRRAIESGHGDPLEGLLPPLDADASQWPTIENSGTDTQRTRYVPR